jgi:hypothetical protein
MRLVAASSTLSDLALVFAIGLGAVLLLIGLSISAAILKMACRTAGVEAPDTGRAMVISFLESLVGGAVYLASTLTVAFVGTAANMERATLGAMLGLSAVGVTFVVPAGLYVPMLRVKFSKGLLIAVLRYVITLSILAVVALGIVAATGKVKFH